jgi:hypothetical protein
MNELAKLKELVEEIGADEPYDRGSITFPWNGEEWISFRCAASEIRRRHELSLGAAQRTLRELCADGDVRSIRYQAAIDPDMQEDAEPIKPNEWLKDQLDFEADDDSDFEDFTGLCIDVSADDLQHWLDKQAGRPTERLVKTVEELMAAPISPKAPIGAKRRKSAKEKFVLMAMNALWPDRSAMELLTGPQITHQVGHWITDHCSKAKLPVPEISDTTILRTAGRKR